MLIFKKQNPLFLTLILIMFASYRIRRLEQFLLIDSKVEFF